MSAVGQTIRWLVVALLLFVGVDLILIGRGSDIAQAVHGIWGGAPVQGASDLIGSLAEQLALTAYALPIGGFFVALAIFIAIFRP